MPRSLVCYAAQVAAVHRVRPWQADLAGYGAGFAAADTARTGAIGEAVKQYCGNAIPSGLLRGSHRELRTRGLAVLDPQELTLFSARQYATPGFPFTPLDIVCHFPPGTSKWNKIEHRLFSHISMNWRGRVLEKS